MTSLWVGIVAIVGVLLGAVAAVVLGWRGRRIDDVPLCRRCGFNLTGLPATSDRCPECGHEIRARRGVRVGHLEWRPGLMGAGLAVLLLMLTTTVAVVWRAVRAGSVRASTPNWYLVSEAQRWVPVNYPAAIDELIRRDTTTPLSRGERDGLARAILDVQADSSAAWKRAWGDWIANRIVDAGIATPLGDEFVDNMLKQWTPTMRRSVRQGDPVPLVWEMTNPRGPNMGPFSSMTSLSIDPSTYRAAVGDDPLEYNLTAELMYINFTRGHSEVTLLRQRAITALPPGEYIIKTEVVARATFRGPVRIRHRWPLTAQFPLTVLPPASDVQAVADASLEPAMSATIVPTTIRRLSPQSPLVLIDVDCQNVPMDVAFEVFVRQRGTEYPVGPLTRRASDPAATLKLGTSIPALESGEGADVLFRASAAAARESMSVSRYWDGHLTFENVPVRGRFGD